ncbi:DMT family transporter [Fusobacteria bacterium ZRK30]|nr:DMT family transporter [Fusobacteria bacterium ZRK30]
MEEKGYGFAFLAGITWGTIGIISYYLGQTGVGPFEITFLRLFSAFLPMFIFYMVRDKEKLKIKKESIKHALLIGIISQGIMGIGMYQCIVRTSVTVGVIMSCTGPLFTALLSRIFFNEKITLFKGISLTLGFYGAFLIVTGGDISVLNTNGFGLLMGAISGLSYGFFPILSKRIPKGSNSLGILIYSFLIGAVFVVPMLDIKILIKALSFEMIGFSLMLGIISTILAYVFYTKALQFISPTKAAIVSLVELPTAAVIGHFFLKEYLYPINILGIFILLTGVIISKIKFPARKNIKRKSFFHTLMIIFL